jgi:hypothetical protein
VDELRRRVRAAARGSDDVELRIPYLRLLQAINCDRPITDSLTFPRLAREDQNGSIRIAMREAVEHAQPDELEADEPANRLE